jgi:hypothetical protein
VCPRPRAHRPPQRTSLQGQISARRDRRISDSQPCRSSHRRKIKDQSVPNILQIHWFPASRRRTTQRTPRHPSQNYQKIHILAEPRSPNQLRLQRCSRLRGPNHTMGTYEVQPAGPPTASRISQTQTSVQQKRSHCSETKNSLTQGHDSQTHPALVQRKFTVLTHTPHRLPPRDSHDDIRLHWYQSRKHSHGNRGQQKRTSPTSRRCQYGTLLGAPEKPKQQKAIVHHQCAPEKQQVPCDHVDTVQHGHRRPSTVLHSHTADGISAQAQKRRSRPRPAFIPSPEREPALSKRGQYAPAIIHQRDMQVKKSPDKIRQALLPEIFQEIRRHRDGRMGRLTANTREETQAQCH